MELFNARMRNLWNDWDLKFMVLLNLVLQVILIFLGARRKFNPKLWLKIIVWGAYISADAVAGVALGILSSKLGEINNQSHGKLDEQSKLMAFWAPSLLLLLGGPDTITAYSLEDNELWLRHLLGLVVQTVVTAYIYIMAWTFSYLSMLEFLMFLAALIKYGERVRVLWLASSEKLRDSMLGAPDPSPNYPRFMEEYSLKQEEGYHVKVDEVDEFQVPENHPETASEFIPEAPELMNANRLFHIFKRLFIDLILSYEDRDLSLSIFKNITWKSAFEIVGMELAFMYDLLHTKAMVLYSRWGLLRRLFTLTVSIFILAFFSVAENLWPTGKYPKVDLAATYLLLTVIVFLEVKSILMLLSSDWTSIWLIKNQGSRVVNMLYRLQWFKQPRYSDSVAQLKFLSFCTKENPPPFQKILSQGLKEKEEKYYYTYHESISPDLKKFIFENLEEMRTEKQEDQDHSYDHKRLATSILKGHDHLSWSTSKLEFDHCILVWHVATELCYHEDKIEEKLSGDIQEGEAMGTYKASIVLSRYMFYLLVRYPFMLPSGIGQIRLRDTFSEALQFLEERGLFSGGPETSGRYVRACKALIEVNTEVPPDKVKGGRSKSVLFEGCRLAKGLKGIEDQKAKWELISKFWMQILVCAASESRGDSHARMLSRGGELLTHVWLIMAHLGLTNHFQMTQSHAIAKLILK